MTATAFDAAVRESVLRKLRLDIGALDRNSDIAAITSIIDRIAKASLDAVEIERLLQTIKTQTGTAMRVLRQQLREVQQHSRRPFDDGTLTPRIEEMNKEYAVVNEGGRVWVMRWRYDPILDRGVLERFKFADFRNLYLNEKLNDTTIAEIWLAHDDRRQYRDGVVFDPTSQVPPSYWNLWRGFAVKPAPGDWSMLRDHIENVICNGVREHFDYALNWLARLVQHPELKGEVAVVMRGGRGVGKGILGRWLWQAFGQHGMQITNPEHLVGKHNSHLRDCVVLFADEAFYAGDKKHEGIFKGLVTEDTITIEPKFVDAITTRNLLHIIMASNEEWVVPAAADERRYFVLDVPNLRQRDIPYFAAITKQMESGGLAAMLHELLARNISTFEVRDVPQTSGLRAQKTLTLNSVQNWWKTVLERGFLYRSRHGMRWFGDWHGFYTTTLLYASYMQWCDDARIYSRTSQVLLGKFMTELYEGQRPRERHPRGEIENYDRELVKNGQDINEVAIDWADRPPGYVVGDLDNAQRAFLKKYDIDAEWTRFPD